MTQPQIKKMRVFLSWSMPRSRAVAQAFKDWLPTVLQNINPYFTPDDIGKGSRWAHEIRGELEASDFGIIFLTPENMASPWILFEAGALSKLEKSKVAPILLDLEPTDVSGPLAQLQLTKFNKEECLKLIKSLNNALENLNLGLEQDVLATTFEKWWPDFEEKVQSATVKTYSSESANKRLDRELLEEIVEKIRALEARPVPLARASLADTNIKELGLSLRAYTCLTREGIHTIAALVAQPAYGLLQIPNFGKSCLAETEKILSEYGLQLRQNSY